MRVFPEAAPLHPLRPFTCDCSSEPLHPMECALPERLPSILLSISHPPFLPPHRPCLTLRCSRVSDPSPTHADITTWVTWTHMTGDRASIPDTLLKVPPRAVRPTKWGIWTWWTLVILTSVPYIHTLASALTTYGRHTVCSTTGHNSTYGSDNS